MLFDSYKRYRQFVLSSAMFLLWGLLSPSGASMACDAYSVVVTDVGTSTTQTARMIRMLTGLEPRVHNDGIASLPVTIAERLSREEAQRFKLRLQSVGTRVRLEWQIRRSRLPWEILYGSGFVLKMIHMWQK